MVDPTCVSSDVDRIDEVWGSPEAWEAQGWQWSRLPAIGRMINRHVTGCEGRDVFEWFFQQVAREQPLPLKRALVLASGQGSMERSLVARGWVEEVVALDISPRIVAVAQENARQENISTIHYRVGDMNDLDVEGPFDIVLGVSALHHCENLESLFDVIKKVLVPGGWFFLDDYVGPNRFQWFDAQVLRINRLLQMLPDRLVRDANGMLRRGFHRTTAEEVAAYDPSEAVRSADILPLLRRNMAVKECHSYGGDVLQLTLATVAQNFDAEISGDPEGATYLDLLIAASDHLRATGRSHDDFAVAIARNAGM